MEDKLSIVQEQRAKNAELKAKSRALKLKKLSLILIQIKQVWNLNSDLFVCVFMLGEAAKDVGVIVPIAPASADDEDGPPEQISNEEAVAKHLKLEMSIAASASARVNPFSESTQYFDWLNLEKTYRELSPAEQQYFVTASLAGHFE